MGDISTEQLAADCLEIVTENAGKKKVKAGDLQKAMAAKYGDQVNRKDVKEAIKELIDSGKCIYGYFGGSSIELPHTEGSANE
jgi:outer membrane protein assembly factor BamA